VEGRCHGARSGVSAAQADIWIFIFKKDQLVKT